jgi:hypothetical protein
MMSEVLLTVWRRENGAVSRGGENISILARVRFADAHLVQVVLFGSSPKSVIAVESV